MVTMGDRVRVVDIRAMNLPMYVRGAGDVPDAVRLRCEAAHDADGILWSSRLYRAAADQRGEAARAAKRR